MEDVWKALGFGKNTTVIGKYLAIASYCCRLCEAPVLIKHAVAILVLLQENDDDCFKN